MSKRLFVLNFLLVTISVALSVHLFRILSAPRPLPPPSVSSVTRATVPIKDESSLSRAEPRAYEIVATRNLFDPNRSEGVVTQAPSRAPNAKPFLYGVVINGAIRLAYLQDPVTKRIFGYRIGDTVAGGQLEQIEEDRVVIKLPEGPLEVKLKDPNKPKPVVRAKKLKPPKRGTPAAVRRPRVRPPQGGAGTPASD